MNLFKRKKSDQKVEFYFNNESDEDFFFSMYDNEIESLMDYFTKIIYDVYKQLKKEKTLTGSSTSVFNMKKEHYLLKINCDFSNKKCWDLFICDFRELSTDEFLDEINLQKNNKITEINKL